MASRDISDRLERRVVISGIGQSAVGRRLGRAPLDLTLDAALAALEDAGLRPSDIDGLATYPGADVGPPGFSGVGVPDVQSALRLDLDWHNGAAESPGQIGAVITAAAAVAAGYCRHVLCFRTVWESSAQGLSGRGGMSGMGPDGRASGFLQWSLPFGGLSAANWVAVMAQRHMHEFGTTREQMAQIALNARRNAALNPAAVYREPLTLDGYLSSRPISTPFCLYDCDVPVDGSTAFVISHVDTVTDLPSIPVHIESVGAAVHHTWSWDQYGDLTTTAAHDAAAMMWKRTDLAPRDVDVAGLYDGFSWLTMGWIEAMGFCGQGESGPFIENGHRIGLGGEIPLNTGGGQLSGGRTHGFGLLHEVCVQLRGDGGARQVPGAGVGVVGVGGGPIGGALLLRRDGA